MYLNDQACLKLNNETTPYFHVTQGVKQGCVLSPTLFNIFLSDLPNLFNTLDMDAPLLNNTKLSSLFWADDIILISTSLSGLQKAMNKLNIYSVENKLSINIKKTKFIVFNKSGKLIIKNTLFYNNQQIEQVRNFIYLGLKLSCCGSWTEALRDLKARGLRAYISLRKLLGDMFHKDIILTLKLFDSLVSPILLYGSDIWGCYKLNEKSPIEQLHSSFCKHILQVNKNTPNIAVKAELGRSSLITKAQINCLKNWLRISHNVVNNIVFNAYKDSLNFNDTWTAKVKNILFLHGLGNIWSSHTSTDFIPSKKINIINSFQFIIKQRLTDSNNQTIISDLQNFPKMRTYIKFKKLNKLENYLIFTNDLNKRFSISKLRLSSHKLKIETGRYENLPVEKRLCDHCQKIDDEFHFVMECSLYITERNVLFDYINKIDKQFQNLDSNYKFNIICMASKNICEEVGVFANLCTKA